MILNIREEFREFENLVVEKLKEQGYPDDSVIREYPVGKNHRADIVVMDKSTKMPLVIVEVKVAKRDESSLEYRAYEQLKKYYNQLNAPAKAIGAIYNTTTDKLNLIDYTDAIKENHYEQKVSGYTFPRYEDLVSGVSQKAIKQKEIKQESNITALKHLCWYALPVFSLILIVLDAIEVYKLSTERLVLIGITFLILLLPCFSEITIWEISLKREKEKQEKQEEKDNG